MLAEHRHVGILRSLHRLNVFVSNRNAVRPVFECCCKCPPLQAIPCRRDSLRVGYCTPSPGSSCDTVLLGKKPGSFNEYGHCFSLGTSEKPLLKPQLQSQPDQKGWGRVYCTNKDTLRLRTFADRSTSSPASLLLLPWLQITSALLPVCLILGNLRHTAACSSNML